MLSKSEIMLDSFIIITQGERLSGEYKGNQEEKGIGAVVTVITSGRLRVKAKMRLRDDTIPVWVVAGILGVVDRGVSRGESRNGVCGSSTWRPRNGKFIWNDKPEREAVWEGGGPKR